MTAKYVLALIAGLAALAAQGGMSQAYTIKGGGAASCGAWTEARRLRAIAGQGEHFLYESWVLGFLSGIGFVGEDNDDPLHGLDYQGVLAWIDNYCQAHPIDNVSHAAIAFYREHPH